MTRAATVATIMTLASYGATLLQQVVYARALGVSADTDALAVCLAWATGIAGLIVTTLASVAIPPFVRSRFDDPAAAHSVFRTATALAVAAALAGATVTAGAAQQVASMLSLGEDAARRIEQLMAPAAVLIILWTVVGILIALANGIERYGHAAASGLATSAVITAALVAAPRPTVDVTIWAYVLGAVAQIAWLLWVTRRDLAATLPWPSRARAARLAALAVPVIVAIGLVNVGTLVPRAIATAGQSGDVALFDYAARLVTAGEQALLAGFLAVALTTWSRPSTPANSSLPVGRTIAIAVGLLIPAAAAIALVAPELVGILLGGGRFTPEDAERVASVVRWMTPGVVAHMIVMLAFRALLAEQSVWPLAAIAFAQLSSLTVAAILLQPLLGVDGIGLSFSVGWLAAVVATYLILRARQVVDAGVIRQTEATCAATGVAAAVALGLLQIGPTSDGLRLVIGLGVFVIVGWAVGKFLGVEFVQITSRRLRPLVGGLR